MTIKDMLNEPVVIFYAQILIVFFLVCCCCIQDHQYPETILMFRPSRLLMIKVLVIENCVLYIHDSGSSNLIPRFLPSFLSHAVHKTGKEPGRPHHVHDDVLCVILCVVLVIELWPMHTVFDFAGCRSVYDSEESLGDYNEQL